MKKWIFVIAGLQALTLTPALANWGVVEDKVDPFADGRHNVIIATTSNGSSLLARCLSGVTSLMLIEQDSSIKVSDNIHITLAGEGKHTHPDFDANVLDANNGFAAMEFADNDLGALSFLHDTNTVYVRVGTPSKTADITFPNAGNGNGLLDHVIKACEKD